MIELFWSIYLAALAVAFLYVLFTYEKDKLTFVDLAVSVFTWVGLFGYVMDEALLTPFFWKFVFIGGLLWDVTFSFKRMVDDPELDEVPKKVMYPAFVVFTAVMIGPLYYGLYQYAF